MDDTKSQYIVGNYRLLNIIGKGNFATVFLGCHVKIGFFVAIKRFAKFEINSEEILSTMQREIMIMRLIDHPYISTLYDILEDDGFVYVVLEYIENSTLLEYIQTNGPMSEEKARSFFLQILSILYYLQYEKGIVHRDIKAENLLLDKNNCLRLIDFGLSNILSQSSLCFSTVCGSPAYVAPEVLTNQPYTFSADIWSSGVLLYTLVASNLPFNDNNLGKLIDMILSSDPFIPPNFSPDLTSLIRAMLEKDPAQRITLDGILKHPWITSFNSHPINLNFKVLSAGRIGADLVDFQADPEILAMMKESDIDISNIQTLLMGNKITPETGVYKALAREKIKLNLPDISLALEEDDTGEKIGIGFLKNPKLNRLPLSGTMPRYDSCFKASMMQQFKKKGIIKPNIPSVEFRVRTSFSHPAYVPGVLMNGKFKK